MLVLITKLHITQYKLLTATTLRRLYLFLSKSPVSYRFFRKCTLVCLYTKHISKCFTKWEPSQTLQQTQCKKKNNLQTFSQSQQHLLRNMQFFWLEFLS